MIRVITLDDLIREARTNPRLRRTGMATGHAGANVEHVTFDQAMERSLTGDESLVEPAERVIEHLNIDGLETHGREWKPAMGGGYVVVPEYLMGRPDCMRGRETDSSEFMPVRLVVDVFASCSFSGKQLRARGLVILALTMMLQRYRAVSLEILSSSLSGYRYEGGSAAGLLIPVQTKPVNLSVAAFLFSPAFFRLLTGSYMDAVMGVPSSIPADTMHQCKAELDLGPDDLYIEPAIGFSEMTEAILGNPREWLQKQLDRFIGGDR